MHLSPFRIFIFFTPKTFQRESVFWSILSCNEYMWNGLSKFKMKTPVNVIFPSSSCSVACNFSHAVCNNLGSLALEFFSLIIYFVYFLLFIFLCFTPNHFAMKNSAWYFPKVITGKLIAKFGFSPFMFLSRVCLKTHACKNSMPLLKRHSSKGPGNTSGNEKCQDFAFLLLSNASQTCFEAYKI